MYRLTHHKRIGKQSCFDPHKAGYLDGIPRLVGDNGCRTILSVALFFSVVVVTVVTVDGRADRRGTRRPLHRHRGDLLVGLRPRDQRRLLAKALIAASGLSLGTLTELAFP
jgi:hypothetical protein